MLNAVLYIFKERPTVDVEQVKFFLGRYFSWIYSAQRSVYYSIVSLDEFEQVTVCGEVNMIQPIKVRQKDTPQ